MIIYKAPGIVIAYGDQTTSFEPQQFYAINSSKELLACEQFVQASSSLCLKELAVLKQVHGSSGIVVDASVIPYDHEGDYLITWQTYRGLGVATADCVPITLYDPIHRLLCMVHAGWKGSIAGVLMRAITHMSNYAKTDPTKLQVFIGPCARTCCYEVSAQWVQDQYAKLTCYKNSVVERDNKIFFDQVGYLIAQLARLGVAQTSIVFEHAYCTICTLRYCSYRRDKEHAKRQMTIACLVED